MDFSPKNDEVLFTFCQWRLKERETEPSTPRGYQVSYPQSLSPVVFQNGGAFDVYDDFVIFCLLEA